MSSIGHANDEHSVVCISNFILTTFYQHCAIIYLLIHPRSSIGSTTVNVLNHVHFSISYENDKLKRKDAVDDPTQLSIFLCN